MQHPPSRTLTHGADQHVVRYRMLFEKMESWVGQLVLHKYYCDKFPEKGELVEGDLTAPRYSYACVKCKTKWEIDPFVLHDTVWQYIRGGHKLIFQEFLKKLDCSVYPGDSYENLFVVFLVMSC